MKYDINKGPKDHAIRMGCETGFYQFIHDYGSDLGMSASSALRRLAMIGARCEAEHGKAVMPAIYHDLHTGTRDLERSKLAAEFNWEDED